MVSDRTREARATDHAAGWRRFRERVGAAMVLDHSGRAGNGFFLTIFDQHPEVLCCPLLHYTYSYAITLFGDRADIPVAEVLDRWPVEYYLRLFHGSLDDEKATFIYKAGGEPDAPIDRTLVADVFAGMLADQATVSRRDLCLLTFYAYAVGAGRDVDRFKMVLFSDSISLRQENALDGFSGLVCDRITADFPDVRLIHLVRDPRAGFASTNHQFVNQLGNMFGIRPGVWGHRFGRLWRGDLDWDSVFVFAFWVLYFRATWEAIERAKARHADRFTTVQNEDLNLAFVPTITALAESLGVSFHAPWAAGEAFAPTMVGRPWHGTGAYNSRYQTKRSGPLENDPDIQARRAVGPNAHVVNRWRTRLRPNEVAVLEHCLGPEIAAYGYDFIATGQAERGHLGAFRRALWQPLAGELPTLTWLRRGFAEGQREGWARLFYAVTFPPFSIVGRRVLERLLRERGLLVAG